MEQLSPTRHDARALQMRMLCPLPRDSERSGTPARPTRNTAAQRRGRSSHVKPRSYISEERSLAGAAPFRRVRSDQNPRGTARAHCKRAWCASYRKTASAMARPRVQLESRLKKRRLELGRRTTVLHRRREVSRWFSALSLYAERLYHTQYGAGALQARMVRPLPRDSVRSGTPARATRKPAAQ